MKTETALLPTWMASALINGDRSSLSLNDDDGAEDEEKLDMVEKWASDQGLSCVSVAEDYEFRNCPPIDAVSIYGETLGGDFCEYTFLGNK